MILNFGFNKHYKKMTRRILHFNHTSKIQNS